VGNKGLISGTRRLGVPGLVPTTPVYGDVLGGDGQWSQPRRTIIPMQTAYPTAAKLSHWQVTTDTRLEVVLLGDSITGGTGASVVTLGWASRIKTLLQRYYGGNGGEGFIPPYDSRCTHTGWQLLTTLPPWESGYRNQALTANVMTFAGVTCDRFDVYYFDRGTGSDANLECQVDGGGYTFTATTTKTGPAYTVRKASFTIGGAVASHTIDIRSPTNANLDLMGISVYEGTAGVVVHNVSRAGYNWLTLEANHINMFSDTGICPHLMIVVLGINDFNTAWGTVGANIKLFLTRMGALTGKGVTDALVLLENNRGNAGNVGNLSAGTGVAQVYEHIKKQTEAMEYPWASIGDWWGDHIQMVADARSSDAIHPNDKGHRDWAAGLWQLLRAT
jgi:lysophospholipase L1-like esterase